MKKTLTLMRAPVATCVATLALAACAARAEIAAPVPKAAVAQGELAGEAGQGVEVFRGIPYAAPPVGDNRWRAPLPAPAWTGVRDATRFGDDCMQDTEHNPAPPGHAVPSSEDCLYLNVWRPAGQSGEPLPVMVWIHGGAFIMGSGAFPTYDGSALARQGVIVVTLNYRLGRFGVFAVPELLAEQAGGPTGNYFLMDQIAALEWVRDNISAFGGDPGNVTIFGESAGASSVNLLMSVPAARGLFDKAITESGPPRAALVPIAGGAGSQAERDLAWARGKGIADGSLEQLRALPAETVLDAPVTEVREPVLDGVLLAEPPATSFAEGRVASVPYLTGANDYEESLLRWLPGALDNFAAALPAAALERGLALFQDAGTGRDAALGDMWGDMAMVEPTRRNAARMAQTGAPVWLYHFSYVPESLRGERPGAGHDNEMEMVFATPSAASAPGWSAADEAMADVVSGYWVTFARSGDPNHAGAPEWPRFTAEADVLMEFARDGAHVRTDFRKDRLDFPEALATGAFKAEQAQ